VHTQISDHHLKKTPVTCRRKRNHHPHSCHIGSKFWTVIMPTCTTVDLAITELYPSNLRINPQQQHSWIWSHCIPVVCVLEQIILTTTGKNKSWSPTIGAKYGARLLILFVLRLLEEVKPLTAVTTTDFGGLSSDIVKNTEGSRLITTGRRFILGTSQCRLSRISSVPETGVLFYFVRTPVYHSILILDAETSECTEGWGFIWCSASNWLLMKGRKK